MTLQIFNLSFEIFDKLITGVPDEWLTLKRISMVSLKVVLALLFIHACSGTKGGSRFRIISGRLADIAEFPYQASIEYHYQQWCGATVYTPKILITAAHCVQVVRHLRVIGRETMKVRVGTSVATEGGSIYTIDKVVPHEEYNSDPSVDEHDIALIVLKASIKFGNDVQPISLAHIDPPDGAKALVTGYGRQNPMRRSLTEKHLMVVEIPIMNREKCENIHQSLGNIVTDKMICAGNNVGSKDSCKGDSGGPLVVDNKLVGVVAWGIGCGREGIPGVYTDIPFYYDWIIENVRKLDKSRSGGNEKNIEDILYRLLVGKSMWA